MTEWTSLSVTEEQKRQIEAAQEQAGHDGAIGRFLVQAVEGGNTTTQIDTDKLTAEIEPLFDGQDVSKGPQFDDVVQACRKALREELPERVLGR